jgi:hypothetical protein
VLYAYGVVRGGQACSLRDRVPMTGLDGARVQILPVGNLGVALSEMSAPPEPMPQRLRAHNSVCLALIQAGGVVPFRFGNVFENEEELCAAVGAKAADLERKLVRLAGCVELNVRVPLEPGERPSSGTDYLRRKKRELELAERLRTELGPALKDWRQEIRHGELRATCLVAAGGAAELKAKLKAFEPEPRLTGPWPPSSFV